MAEKDAKKRVLIVEDQMLIALALEMDVENLRYSVCGIAASAAEAVELADRHRPDFILMDVRLAGDTDGVEAAGEINERFAIRSLYLTAQIDERTRDRMSDTNSLGVLPKPYSPQDLRIALYTASETVREEKRRR